MRSFDWRHLLVLLMIIGSGGCDATRELIKAPFDATSAVANGSTQATGELTEPTTEITSSTTPNSLFRNEEQLRRFITHNFTNLQHDVARGHGEYISSMAILADIPFDRHRQLFAVLQDRYPILYSHEIAQTESLQRLMDAMRTTYF